MFFGKHFSKVKDFLGHGYAKTKDFLGKGYAKGKEILGKLNDGYGHAKQIYDAVSPLVDKYLPSNTSKTIKDAVNKGMSEYENIREKVIDKHDHIKDNLNDIVGHLKKHKIKV
jgi:hypothetical protein